MNNLDDSQKQYIDTLQIKINRYQYEDLCSELDLNQYRILAELQTIYNILTKTSISNIPSLYNNTCKGVQDEMQQFISIYSNKNTEELYKIYMEKYNQAKKEPYNLIEL